MRLCNWGLFVRVTVHLERRLQFRTKGKIRKEGWGQTREIRTSPYSFVSHISKSGRRLPSCSLQRTMGCIVPDTPLKETEALSSRFAALVFAVKIRVSIGCDIHENDEGSLVGSQSRTCSRGTMRKRCGILPDSHCTGRLRHELGCTKYISGLRSLVSVSHEGTKSPTHC
jgi:hypothetical protein